MCWPVRPGEGSWALPALWRTGGPQHPGVIGKILAHVGLAVSPGNPGAPLKPAPATPDGAPGPNAPGARGVVAAAPRPLAAPVAWRAPAGRVGALTRRAVDSGRQDR